MDTTTLHPCVAYAGPHLEEYYRQHNSTQYKGDSHLKLAVNVYYSLGCTASAQEFSNIYSNWYLNAKEPFNNFYYTKENIQSKANSLIKAFKKKEKTNPCYKYSSRVGIDCQLCEVCIYSPTYKNARIEIENKILNYSIRMGDTDFLKIFCNSFLSNSYYDFVMYSVVKEHFCSATTIIDDEKVFSCHINSLVAYWIAKNYREFSADGKIFSTIQELITNNDTEGLINYILLNVYNTSSLGANSNEYIPCSYEVFKYNAWEHMKSLFESKNITKQEYADLYSCLRDTYAYEVPVIDTMEHQEEADISSLETSTSVVDELCGQNPLIAPFLAAPIANDVVITQMHKDNKYNFDTVQSMSLSSDSVTNEGVSSEQDNLITAVPESLISPEKLVSDNNIEVPINKPSDEPDVGNFNLSELITRTTDNEDFVDSEISNNEVAKEFSSPVVTDISTDENIQELNDLYADVDIDMYYDEIANAELKATDDVAAELSEPAEKEPSEFAKEFTDEVTISQPVEAAEISVESETIPTTNAVETTEAESETIPATNAVETTKDISADGISNFKIASLYQYDISNNGFVKKINSFLQVDDTDYANLYANCLCAIQGAKFIPIEYCYYEAAASYGILFATGNNFWFVTPDCNGFRDVLWHMFSIEAPKISINVAGVQYALNLAGVRVRELHSLSYMHSCISGTGKDITLEDLFTPIGAKIEPHKNILEQLLPLYDECHNYLRAQAKSLTHVIRQNMLDIALTMSFDLTDFFTDFPVPSVSTSNFVDIVTCTLEEAKEKLVRNGTNTLVILKYSPEMFSGDNNSLKYAKEIIVELSKNSFMKRLSMKVVSIEDYSLAVLCSFNNAYAVSDILTTVGKDTYKALFPDNECIPDFEVELYR